MSRTLAVPRPAEGLLHPWALGLWLAVTALLFLVFRQAPVTQIAAIFTRLQPGPLAALVGLNLVFLFLLNLRWWVLLRCLGWRVSLAALFAYRLAGFGVSYHTPGPQFGGEPVQVHLLHSREGVRVEDAVTVARFAFLLPLPAGLGALEASQVLAAQMFGWGAAAGIATSLVIRVRDLFLALAGVALGVHSYRAYFFPRYSKKERS